MQAGGGVPGVSPGEPAKIHLTFSQNNTVESHVAHDAMPDRYTYQVAKKHVLDPRYGKPLGTELRGVIADGADIKAIFCAPKLARVARKKFARLGPAERQSIQHDRPQAIDRLVPEMAHRSSTRLPDRSSYEQYFHARRTDYPSKFGPPMGPAREPVFMPQPMHAFFGAKPHDAENPRPAAVASARRLPSYRVLSATLLAAAGIGVIAIAVFLYNHRKKIQARRQTSGAAGVPSFSA